MNELTTTLRLTVLTLLVCSVGYAAAMLAFAQIVTPWTANGSLVTNDSGVVVGSVQVAQAFTQLEYFWPRPSAVDYDASATGGSNLSPANPTLTERAQHLIEQYSEQGQEIPADLVSSSGSGIDPHITLRAALFQVPRVAASRDIPEEIVHDLVMENSESTGPMPGTQAKVVNVLRLNMALESFKDGSQE